MHLLSHSFHEIIKEKSGYGLAGSSAWRLINLQWSISWAVFSSGNLSGEESASTLRLLAEFLSLQLCD